MSALELDFGTEFLDHSTRASGSGFLKNWKEDGTIVVWVNPGAPVLSLWSHSWFRYSVETDKDTDAETTVIRGQRVNCLENEKLLKKQKWRTDDDEREVPPVICPHCLCVEWVREQINEGKLEWSTPIFKFAVDGDTPIGGEEAVIYAGGFCGMFQRRKISEEEMAEIRKTGVKISEAYKQNGYARQQYVMVVASDNEVDDGWMITFEGQTLGDKMKKCIRDEIKRCGGEVEEGHPKFNPYPFEWTYDDNKEFSDKYDVVALSRKRPSEKVEALLESDEVPDLRKVAEPPKLGSLRQSMEEAALVEMPFDEFFGAAVEQYGNEFYGDEEDDDEEAGDEPEGEVETADEAEDDVGGEGDIGCDVCNHPLAEDDMECAGCGAKYGADDEGNVFLASRACGNPKCPNKAVSVDESGGGKCEECGGEHDAEWKCVVPKKPSTGKKASKRQGKKAPRKTTEHSDARPSRRSRARAALSE